MVALRRDFLFFLFLLIQILLWFQFNKIKPDLHVVPPLPSERTIRATSFGDEQFYFRLLAYEIQNAGDSFGRTTPLKDYDYDKLQKWFFMLDSLDVVSNYVPALAAYYYSNTQNTPDVRYIVDYLEKHADRDPNKKWWWYSQAIYNAKHKLKDKKTALRLAYKLASVKGENIPIWTRQMPAFILSDMGEEEQALIIIGDILNNSENLDPGEINFMNYFINERLKSLNEGILKGK